MLATAAALMVLYYRGGLTRNKTARTITLVLFVAAFATAAVVGLFGALWRHPPAEGVLLPRGPGDGDDTARARGKPAAQCATCPQRGSVHAPMASGPPHATVRLETITFAPGILA